MTRFFGLRRVRHFLWLVVSCQTFILGSFTCGPLLVITLLFRRGHILGQPVENQFRHIWRPFSAKSRPAYHQLKAVFSVETVQILGLSVQFSFLLRLQVLLHEEFFDAQRIYLLDVLLKHLSHWVASALKQMHQVHDLLLAQFQISHLVLQPLTHLFKLVILSHERVHVFNKLSI